MNGYLITAVAVLFVLLLILLSRIYLLQKAADAVREEFQRHLSEETNTLIDLPIRDRHLCRLASEMNHQLKVLRDKRHRFEQGNSELTEAVTNISHDLRTPLTALCGYLELLKEEPLTEKQERYVQMIENRTEVLKDLTEELFRYSVLVNVTEESKELLSVQQVLEESLLSFYGVMKQRNMEPDLSISENRVERNLNRSALSRIFGNIISNALKYSDGDLSVSLSEDGTICFSNSAKKMDEVSVGRLFDRFYTVENGRGGTGLGLSIAKLLTERMGGTISAKYENQKLSILLRF